MICGFAFSTILVAKVQTIITAPTRVNSHYIPQPYTTKIAPTCLSAVRCTVQYNTSSTTIPLLLRHDSSPALVANRDERDDVAPTSSPTPLANPQIPSPTRASLTTQQQHKPDYHHNHTYLRKPPSQPLKSPPLNQQPPRRYAPSPPPLPPSPSLPFPP